MEGGGGEEGDYIPITHCHHQNDSSESHFNVSLIVRDKVSRRQREKESRSFEPRSSAYQPNKKEEKKKQTTTTNKQQQQN